MPGMIVTLTEGELLRPVTVGAYAEARHQLAKALGKCRPDRNGQRGGPQLDPWDRVVSACAECAVAKALGRYWVGDWWTRIKTPDIPPNIEVRWINKPNNHLLIYDDDKDNDKFILVRGAIPTFELIGWIFAKDGKLSEWYEPIKDGRAWAYKVPQDALWPDFTPLMADRKSHEPLADASREERYGYPQ